jgi:hypothetical protein
MFGYNKPIAFSVPQSAEQQAAERNEQANERINEQAKHDGKRSRQPAERMMSVSAIVTVETTRRAEFPNLVRGVSETAHQFADRVRDELVRLQREPEAQADIDARRARVRLALDDIGYVDGTTDGRVLPEHVDAVIAAVLGKAP